MEKERNQNRFWYKKIAFVVLIAACLLPASFFAGVKTANIEKSVTGKASGKRIPVSLVGVVERVEKTGFSILVVETEETGVEKTDGIKTKVMTGDKTIYYATAVDKNGILAPKKISAGDLRKGNVVTVEATITEDTGFVILARRIMVSPDKKTLESASYESPMESGRAMFGFAGDVTENEFTLTDTEGKATRIIVNKDTEVVAGGSANTRPFPATYAAVTNGLKISLFGEIQENGDLKATHIAVAK